MLDERHFCPQLRFLVQTRAGKLLIADAVAASTQNHARHPGLGRAEIVAGISHSPVDATTPTRAFGVRYKGNMQLCRMGKLLPDYGAVPKNVLSAPPAKQGPHPGRDPAVRALSLCSDGFSLPAVDKQSSNYIAFL